MKTIKTTLVILPATLFCQFVFSQQKEYEGKATYNVEVRSNIEGISDRALQNFFALGKTVTVYTKHGHYRQITPVCDIYFSPEQQKVFTRYKGIDTLFYTLYDLDSTKLINLKKSDEQKSIAGIPCNSLSIETDMYKVKYFYAPSLYVNPGFDQHNTNCRFDLFLKETSSLYLAYTQDWKKFSVSEACTKVEPGSVDDSLFQLPTLPIVKFTVEAITHPAEFVKLGGWSNYLQLNLNADLGAKYIKISKGESSAKQTVQLKFMVDEFGQVTNVMVLNKDDVHSKLAQEAVRVVTESPIWKPATVLGQKTFYWMEQPVTFIAEKK